MSIHDGLLRRMLLFLLIIGAARPSLGADCTSLAQWGIYDTTTNLSDQQQADSFSYWFCSHKFSSFGEASSASASVGIPIGELPVQLGWDGNDSSWSTSEENFCSSSTEHHSYSQQIETFVKKANPSVLNVIKQCLSMPGVHAYIINPSDSSKFVINMVFQPFGPITSATIKNVILSPATAAQSCQPTLPLDAAHNKLENQAQLQILCVAPADDDVMVAINADEPMTVDGSLHVPKKYRPSGNPQPQLPSLGIQRFCNTGTLSETPDVRVTVPSGYKIIGGGASVNYVGDVGSLLTASYPETLDTWYARAKDHSVYQVASVPACVLAVNDRYNEWDVRIWTNSAGPSGDVTAVTVDVPQGFVMTGGGANTVNDPIGQLLTASYPSATGTWRASSKAHSVNRTTVLTAFAIGMRPRNGSQAPESRIFTGAGNTVRPRRAPSIDEMRLSDQLLVSVMPSAGRPGDRRDT